MEPSAVMLGSRMLSCECLTVLMFPGDLHWGFIRLKFWIRKERFIIIIISSQPVVRRHALRSVFILQVHLFAILNFDSVVRASVGHSSIQ